MENQKVVITVDVTVNAPVEKVWNCYTEPQSIVKWNQASEDWHTTRAENDLRKGGKFLSRMEARDGSFGFDFVGIYDEVRPYEFIEYTMGDGRNAKINFTQNGNTTHLVIAFEAETENTLELQKGGWQAILNSFKKYAESN